MASFNLDLNSLFPHKKRHLNFITIKPDHTSELLKIGLIISLVATVFLTISWIGLSYYAARLEQELEIIKANLNTGVNSLRTTLPFENEFLIVQNKLALYGEINANERMVELFSVIRAIIPVGVVLQDMTIYPNSVQITASAETQTILSLFYNNLQQANNQRLGDNLLLEIGDVDYKEVAKDTSSQTSSREGFTMNFSFNYRIGITNGI
jgi:hypothetical protein